MSQLLPLAALLALALAACAGQTAPEPVTAPVPAHPDTLTLPDGSRVELGGLAPALRTCLNDACGDAADRAAFDACRASSCEASTERWSISPTAVHYDRTTGMIRVQAQARHAAGEVDGEALVRAREAYVGVTVVTEAGEEIDLAVQTLFPGRLSEELMFLAEVGPGVQDILFGVWDRKIEPCDDARSGCRNFGFLLDGSLATWPPKVYEDGKRQRILPPTVQLQPRYGGGSVTGFQAAVERATAVLGERAATFGTTVELLPAVIAPRPTPAAHWAHAHDHDVVIARSVAAAFPKAHVARLDGPDFAFTFGTPIDQDAWTCVRSCEGKGELLGCLTTTCGL
jgi:hypothetical protein